MTNNEYEKMSVDAAAAQFKLDAVDAQIKAHQDALDYLNEHRRELINRYNLNKCSHRYLVDSDRCPDCGELIQ